MRTSPDNSSFIRAPIAVVLAWLIPGLGHFYLGHKTRGIIFLVVITLTFCTGAAIGGVKTISPTRVTYKADRIRIDDEKIEVRSWWFFGQILNGGYALTACAVGKYSDPTNVDGVPRYLAWPSGDVGSVYSGIAGLLNLLIIIDVLARAEGPVPTVARAGRSKGSSPSSKRGD